MDQPGLTRLMQEFREKEDQVMGWKAGEYSRDEDRLENFRSIAAFRGQAMSEVAMSYLMKHIQGLDKAVRTGNYNWVWETGAREGLKQRVADARNYLLLLAACLEEETREKPAAGE